MFSEEKSEIGLFSAQKINGETVKNRVVLAPMDTELAYRDGSVSPRMIDYYTDRAKGGAGLIISEFTAVENAQRMTSPGIYSDRMISDWNELVESVHTFETKIFSQLALHGGRALARITGKTPVAPSAIKSPLYVDKSVRLTVKEIEGLINEFVEAAVRAKRAGFDGVEVHGGHTYLIGQFVSSHTNRRNDQFGGSLEKRLRFPRRIIEGIREKCGQNFPIGFKFSAFEALEDGITVEEAKKIASRMEETGSDYLHVSATTYGLTEDQYQSVSPIYSEKNGLADLAQQVKNNVDIPVIAVGGINKPEDARKILNQRQADMVAIGRGLIADPSWVKKAKREEAVRPCIRCNECHTRIMNQKKLRCSVNPWVGRDSDFGNESRSSEKKVAVIGAGPGGLQAALTAERAGNQVTIYEKEGYIGGNMKRAAAPSFKREVRRLYEHYKRRIADSDLEVKLNTPADKSLLEETEARVIVVAVGGETVWPDIDGLDKSEALTALQVLDNGGVKGQSVAVIGGGLVGCEVGLFLSLQGKDVTVIDKVGEQELMTEEHSTNRAVLLNKVKDEGAELITKTDILRIRGKELVLSGPEGSQWSRAFDQLVMATGLKPRTYLWNQLRGSSLDRSVEFFRVGDCRKPGRFFEAINEGALIGEAL